MSRIYLGRHAYGLAAVAFGVISFVWHDFGVPWQQMPGLGGPHRELLVYSIAAIEIFGGLAIQWRRTAHIGALILGAIFLMWALLWVPRAVSAPRVYDGYGNFFEQFSIASGAIIIYGKYSERERLRSIFYAWASDTSRRQSSSRAIAATPTPQDPSQLFSRISRLGYIFFGICVISFMLVHIFYLSAVVSFTPKWIPPGPMFWAVSTTIAFGLAAVALLTGRSALLASRLLTAMIMGFGLLVWLPRPFADPHQLFNWAGNAQNLAIAGAAWIVADYLSQICPASMRSLARAA